MNTQWDLTGLYSGFDDPKLASDLDLAEAQARQMQSFAKDLSGQPEQVVRSAIDRLEQFSRVQAKIGLFASLSQAVNAADEQAAACLGRLQAIQSSTAAPRTAICEYIAAQNLDELIAAEPSLEEFRYFLQCIQSDSRYLLSQQAEEIISLYSISGSSAWSDMQNYLTSALPVEYAGETTNLSDIRNRAYDPDPDVRKAAYAAELAAYDRIRDAVAFSLNSIKLEVLNHCRLRGYESPLDEALKNARMQKQTLDALLTALAEYLPRFWEYMKAKARYLGHKNGLPWYDLFAPLGGNNRKYTIEEACDYLVDIFGDFDDELAEMIRTAFSDAWIDFYPRAGKSGGAFCAEVYSLKQSRILTNFNGDFSDIVTLAHELGHAFHSQQLKDNAILNTEYSMPVAETASTFNEILVMKTAIAREEDPKVRLTLIESRLMDLNQIICDIYSRYLFEKAVFDTRDRQFLFADNLCGMMLQAQKTAYGDGLDPEVMHPYMWICKSHYYSGDLSYYNWPYAFGGLFGMGLYAKYQAEGQSFVPLYKKMLRATATCSVEDAASIAGIDISDPNFWRMSLDAASEEIDAFIALCRECG